MRGSSLRAWLTPIPISPGQWDRRLAGRGAKRGPVVLSAIVIGLAATLLVLARLGYWRMFSVFFEHDDEGCLLIAIRSFLAGHALYDDVISMYGPLPLLVRATLFAATGQPVGHDVGRLLSLGNWLLTAAVCGAIAWRLTGSVIAGWAGIIFVFEVLRMSISEPGHPQEFCGLLLSLVVLLATFVGPRSGRRAFPLAAGIGVIAGGLAMSKINVFVFLMLALGAAALALTPRTRLVTAFRLVCAVAVLAAPTLLMRQRLEVPAFRSYALFVTLALVPAVLLAFGGRSRSFLGLRHYLWLSAGLLGSVGAIVGIVLYCGTTPGGLLDGVLLIPLRAGTLFISATTYFDGRWPIPVAFGVGALGWLGLERTGHAARPVAALAAAGARIACGLYPLGRALDVTCETLFVLGVPAAVLLLLPRNVADRSTGDAFGRHVLAFLAITESLWAFPVAGSQQAFSTFLAVLVLVVVAADGCRDFAAVCRRWQWWPTWTARWLAPGAVVAALLPILRAEVDGARSRYEGSVSLGLPGAQAIHVDAGLAHYYQSVTEALRALPDTFFTLPGMYSFYFWTGRESPTTLNLTNWMYILDDRQQERIVAQLAAYPQLRVLVSPPLIQFWMQGTSLPPAPLVRYLTTGFEQESTVGSAVIWARRVGPVEPGVPAVKPAAGITMAPCPAPRSSRLAALISAVCIPRSTGASGCLLSFGAPPRMTPWSAANHIALRSGQPVFIATDKLGPCYGKRRGGPLDVGHAAADRGRDVGRHRAGAPLPPRRLEGGTCRRPGRGAAGAFRRRAGAAGGGVRHAAPRRRVGGPKHRWRRSLRCASRVVGKADLGSDAELLGPRALARAVRSSPAARGGMACPLVGCRAGRRERRRRVSDVDAVSLRFTQARTIALYEVGEFREDFMAGDPPVVIRTVAGTG